MRADGLKDGVVFVLCPLEVERRAVARAIARANVAENIALICTGPGPRAMAAAVSRLQLGARRDDVGPTRLLPWLVVLAGLGGGLCDVEPVPPIGRVVDADGRCWDSTGDHGTGNGTGAVLVGVDDPVCTPEAKQALHARTGAAIVDTESHTFASACNAAGIAWAVIRGVSDPWDTALPPQASQWVDGRGRTRLGRLAADVARRPQLVGALARLGRASGRVLPAVGERVVEVIRSAGERVPRR